MSALSESRAPEVVELRHVCARQMAPLLEEEVESWSSTLSWDFRASADLVMRFMEMHALNGHALLAGGEVAGYAYYVSEDRKGLIGDLFVAERYAAQRNEWMLLEAVVRDLVETPHVARVESQLMLLRGLSSRTLPYPGFAEAYPRLFMVIDLAAVAGLPRGRAASRLRIERWTDRHTDDAAAVISAAYRGHIDSEINDQYRSAAGARRFLTNIVQYPGCGRFFQPASLVAVEGESGKPCGICLTSHVAERVGHVTQICVVPAWQGTGVGYELMRRSLQSLAAAGCSSASLTVTASNREAVALYERVGFRIHRRFDAFVWDGF